ncbi:NAD(P)-dependent oxidoreductase [Actinomadura flavalba]|uniref:NAD(P)-dependent oxidoreductase n=1 Tax=Actinomadura flavalba TaxID=1120938 RepID=UPI0003745754|nr:NAD(P)H-binding protein [Actinomadura flavalba]
MNIVIFGAGGRVGRAAVVEARRRGHAVTAVVREPARYPDGTAVAGDVTDADDIARVAAGQDVAVHAAADLSADPAAFFTTAARALAEGLSAAGVQRLVAVGLAPVLPGPSGALLMDEPGYPQEYRSFYLGHAAGLDELRSSHLDWAYLAPAGDFDHDGPSGHAYRFTDHGDPTARITPADFALALIDEAETPRHRAATASVTTPQGT